MSRVRLTGSTSGYVEITAPAISGNNTVTLPSSNGSANQLLKNGATPGVLEYSTVSIGSTGELDNIASINGGALAGTRNRIINGNFDIWQRGTSFSPASNTYTADRWAVVYNGVLATRTVSRGTFIPGSTEAAPGAAFFLGFNQSVAGFGGINNSLVQRIEDVRTFEGQTATLSFYARGLSASLTLPAIGLSQVFGVSGSATVFTTVASSVVIAGTNFAKYTYTVTLPSIIGKTIGTGSYLSLDFAMPNNATFNFQIGSVQLESGSVATPFEQRPIGTELALCQRYCQRKEFDMRVLATAASANYAFSQHLPVSMRATPTATFISNTSALNTASVFVAPLSIDTIRFTVASSASGDMFRQDLYQLSSEL